MHFARIRDDDRPYMRRDNLHHGGSVASGFHDNVVVMFEPTSECFQVVTSHANPTQSYDFSFIKHHRFR